MPGWLLPAAAVAGPAIGKALGSLFGPKMPSAEEQWARYKQNLSEMLGYLPKLDTAGMEKRALSEIKGGMRGALANLYTGYQKMYGPNVRTAAAAGAGTGLRQRATEAGIRAISDIGLMAPQFELSRFGTAAGAAGAPFGSQVAAMSQGSRWQDLFRNLAEGGGQAAGDYYGYDLDYNRLLKMLGNPEIRAMLGLQPVAGKP